MIGFLGYRLAEVSDSDVLRIGSLFRHRHFKLHFSSVKLQKEDLRFWLVAGAGGSTSRYSSPVVAFPITTPHSSVAAPKIKLTQYV